MTTGRRKVVAVIGDARLEDPVRRERLRKLGSRLVAEGHRIITGGLGGVMAAVSEGAKKSRHWFDGAVIGVVPSYKASNANEWCDIVIPTGMQAARNVIVVASADAVVADGGGAGTMSELAMAWQLDKPIIALGSEGWAGECGGRALDRRSSREIRACGDVDAAIDEISTALKAVESGAQEPGKIGDGSRKKT